MTAGWRCFHCGEVFTKHTEAAAHFGYEQDATPACKIAPDLVGLIQHMRWQEGELHRYRTDDSTAHREFYKIGAEHNQALRTEEEKGYARGLADGRALGPGWVAFENAPAGSYACVHAPEGKLEGADLSWMPADRGQIPQHARRGMILPLPELKEGA